MFNSNCKNTLNNFSDLDSDSDDDLDLMSRRRSSAVSNTQIKSRFQHSNGAISEEEDELEQQDREQNEFQSYV